MVDGERAAWPSRFGLGRPGWHIGCSAMAHRYLGQRFDIHGGGLDLRFPHHENEEAQSRALGYEFANRWMHHGLVTRMGTKIGKPVGNAIDLRRLIAAHRAIDLRYYLGSVHYRSQLKLDNDALAASALAVRRIENFLWRASGTSSRTPRSAAPTSLPCAFAAAMDDDLNVAKALAVLHETIRHGNAALDQGETSAVARDGSDVLAMTSVLGVNPSESLWASPDTDRASEVLGALVATILEERTSAKVLGEWDRADRLRALLSDAGVEVIDDVERSSWRI